MRYVLLKKWAYSPQKKSEKCFSKYVFDFYDSKSQLSDGDVVKVLLVIAIVYAWNFDVPVPEQYWHYFGYQ